jgi:tRNA-dihydrouridine synthase B
MSDSDRRPAGSGRPAVYNRAMVRIGSLQLDIPVAQAALSGYSDSAMRRIARRCGAPYALNEVVLDRLVLAKGRKRNRILRVADDDHPLGGQLMGAEPEPFAEAAGEMVAAGYDAIDINFGCPVRKVLSRCRGGYLLSEPAAALDIVRRVIDAVGGRRPVTVKMRRGMDETPASGRNFFRILDGALAAGVNAVTVHARTVRQRYVGPSDWSFLARVRRHVRDGVILFGSGDLFSAEDVVRMMDETGVDGVTIARGCIGNPFVFRDCRALLTGRPLPPPPTVAEVREVIAEHFGLAVGVQGEKRAGPIMRKFGVQYARHHPYADQVREAFVRAKTPADWQAVLDRWYDPTVDWPPFRRAVVPEANERVEAGRGASP